MAKGGTFLRKRQSSPNLSWDSTWPFVLLPLSPSFFRVKLRESREAFTMWPMPLSHFTLTPGRNPLFLLPPRAACSVEEILEIIAPKTAGGGEHYQLCLNLQCPKLSISSSSCEQQVHLGALQVYRPPGMWPKVSETLGPLLVAWGADQGL